MPFPVCQRFRDRLTIDDVAFVASAVGSNINDIGSLLSDGSVSDEILDSEKLFVSLMGGGVTSVSPCLLFYVLVRHEIKREYPRPEVADYVASALAVFVDGEERPAEHVLDSMVAASNAANESVRVRVLVHLGDSMLYSVGLHPEWIRHREERRGSPGVAYYKWAAERAYGEAGMSHLAMESGSSGILLQMSSSFERMVLAVERCSEFIGR